jgi:hypothetical protein
MGDSVTYIVSAITGNTPVDRSFTYGLLIRWTALAFGSLDALVAAQIIAGAATAWLMALALLLFFRVRPSLAVAATAAFAFDPMQLLHERLVMAETFALLAFAVNLLLALWYLRRPSLLILFGVCMTGILLVSLRFMYIPHVLALATLLPLVAWSCFPAARTRGRRWPVCVLHLAFGLAVSGFLHAGYRHIVGERTGRPAAYSYRDGLMLASSWAPLLRPEDATDSRAADVIARQTADVLYPLRDRTLRAMQMWNQGGLVSRLVEAYAGDLNAANKCAKRICRATLRRDPLAVASFASRSFVEYLNPPHGLRKRLLGEQGSTRPLDKDFVETLRHQFGLEAANSHADMTPSRRFHLAGSTWYIFLFLSPFVWLVNLWAHPSSSRPGAMLLLLVTTFLLAVICITGPDAIYRYLHSFSFTGIMALCVLVESCLAKVRAQSTPNPSWISTHSD